MVAVEGCSEHCSMKERGGSFVRLDKWATSHEGRHERTKLKRKEGIFLVTVNNILPAVGAVQLSLYVCDCHFLSHPFTLLSLYPVGLQNVSLSQRNLCLLIL